MKMYELKQHRHEQAEERNQYWNTLTIDQQLLSLKERRGESKKQIAKLEKMKRQGLTHSSKKVCTPAQEVSGIDESNTKDGRKKKQEAKEFRAKKKRKEIDGY